MNVLAQKFAIVFGLCVTIVSLCSGCATGAPGAQAISLHELNYFQPDCKIKEQQLKFLQSLRSSPDDRLFTINGWHGVNDRIEWTINAHITHLIQYC